MEALPLPATRAGSTVAVHFAVGAGLALLGVAIVEGVFLAGLRPLSPLGWPGLAVLIAAALAGLPGFTGGTVVALLYLALNLAHPQRFPDFFASPAIPASWLLALGVLAAATLSMRPRLLRAAIAEAELTSLKRYEKALRESEARLRVITDNLPAFVAYVDADERFQFVNRTYEDWFRRPRDQIIGRTVREVWGEERYALFSPNIARALAGERITLDYALVEAGTERRILARYVPDVGPGGRVKGYFILGSDVTELGVSGKPRVLIVDDDDSLRELLALHLRNAGYEVLQAEDAIAAAPLVIEHIPDVLIVDVEMPYMSGYEFVRALKSDPATQKIPVLFLTIDRGVPAEAAKVGASYLIKPVRADVLLERVQELVRS